MRLRMFFHIVFTIGSAIWAAITNAQNVKEMVNLAGFQIQWSLIAFLVFFCFVIWWIIELECYKYRIENSKPNLIFQSREQWPIYHNGKPAYWALQAWFINKPQISSENSIAQDVDAKIVFYNRNTKHTFEIFGCFTEAEYLDYATINPIERLKDKIDIWPPNEIPQKLLLTLKYPGEHDAYGFAKSNFKSNIDGKMPQRKIVEGEYYVKVTFSGTKIDQKPFWFLLINSSDIELSFSQETKKPNLRKEGYQI